MMDEFYPSLNPHKMGATLTFFSPFLLYFDKKYGWLV